MNLKKIEIGKKIEALVKERKINIERACNFLKCTPEDVEKMYKANDITCELLLKWSKLLEYDLFRLYSQHLILYSPKSANTKENKSQTTNDSAFPVFRKNLYTSEIIDYILELIQSGKKTRNQVIEEYNIPKTTLYKWINKYNQEK
ncbi:helix-turn-helix domain-containing protein [Empedobacter brevis]|nr:helix-turn-helix domain-containing protein [Empedobacter brevis]